MFDLTKSYCRFFSEICKIPHGSGNEKALSDWLVSFAKQRGLRVLQDALWNAVIYKPASPGYEDHPGVIIQAHMDMVCEKVPESTHNFETDALELYTEGDHLRARGTTLGADDGMGCAYMLAILDDKALPHPYLECCFTTQEEVGLVGAQALKPEYFQARRLINLDGAGEYRTFMSMGGGEKHTLRRSFSTAASKEPVYRATVEGLLGGHSGGMIDKERANANKLLSRVLLRLSYKGIPYRLISWEGGSKANVITPRAACTLTCAAPQTELQALAAECMRDFHDLYEFSDQGVAVSLTREAPAAGEALSEADSRLISEFVRLLPQGQLARNLELSIPAASANVGVCTLSQGEFTALVSVRSALDAWFRELGEQITLLARLYGFSTAVSDQYPGWRYEPQSPLRETMKTVFEEIYHQPLQCLAGHGGNECGVFKLMHPDMDIVTSGAIYGAIHSTDEFLDIPSFHRAYHLLTTLLARL